MEKTQPAIASPILQRDQVLATVQAHQSSLEKLGVKSLALFGSVAQKTNHVDSDVDFLVELSSSIGLFGLFKIQHYLEEILHCSVDLGTQKSLKQHLREPILKGSIRVF